MATLLVVLVVLLSTVVAAPAADDKPTSPQAQRMKDCNAQARAGSLAGEARRRFMSECLKGKGPGAAERSGQGAPGASAPVAPSESNPTAKR